MARTYKAILEGDRVEWIDGPPETNERTPVHIIVLDKTQRQPSQTEEKTAGELLQTLADMDAFSGITDPVAWQREQRKGRPLPHRDARLASFDCCTRSQRVCDGPYLGTS